MALGQRVYDDTEAYDWSEFDLQYFLISAVICSIIISIGYSIRTYSTNKLTKGSGTTLWTIGGIGTLGTVASPILAAIQFLWQWLIIIGFSAFILYSIFGSFFESDPDE
jgi:hypothetical protein